MSAKKSFKNSPAMQFITPLEESAPENTPPRAPSLNQATQDNRPVSTFTEKQPSPPPPPSPAPPSDFSFPPNEEKDLTEFIVPMKKNPIYIETRSKRVQLLMQPTLHSTLKKMAQTRNISLNDLIHQVMEDFIHQDTP